MSAVRIDSKMLAARFAALAELVPLSPLKTRKDYDRAVKSLDAILDAGGDDETHPLADLAGLIGSLIEEYEQRHFPMPKASGAAVLRFLMDQHGLRQADLPELGSQGVVSELLSGKRDFRGAHLRALSERFGVPADAFL